MVRASEFLRVSLDTGEIVTGGVKQIWSSRGEGWGCHPGSLRERSASTREGFLRALPFSLVVCSLVFWQLRQSRCASSRERRQTCPDSSRGARFTYSATA